MIKIPTTFSEKLALSVLHSQREINFRAKAAFVHLASIRAQRDLDYAIINEFPEDYVARARDALTEADMLDYQYEQRLCEDRDPGFHCWSSGYHFDDNGLEVWATISFDPLSFRFNVVKHNEGGSYYVGSGDTFEEADSIASRVLYGEEEDLEPRPTPTISKDESDLAGNVIVSWHGSQTSIKDIVGEILDRANNGCGQHYEIFAKRATSALDSLTDVLAGEDLGNAMKYLQYERY